MLHLFIRLFLGVIICSSSFSKIIHLKRFKQAILDYQLIPSSLEKLFLSTLLSFSFPAIELMAGLGLLTGLFLAPSTILTIGLFIVFSIALIINLLRGRNDLSCHCEGALGSHQISWRLVERNIFLVVIASVLLTAPDQLTVESLLSKPALLYETVSTIIVPTALIVGVLLLILVPANSARVLFIDGKKLPDDAVKH